MSITPGVNRGNLPLSILLAPTGRNLCYYCNTPIGAIVRWGSRCPSAYTGGYSYCVPQGRFSIAASTRRNPEVPLRFTCGSWGELIAFAILIDLHTSTLS